MWHRYFWWGITNEIAGNFYIPSITITCFRCFSSWHCWFFEWKLTIIVGFTICGRNIFANLSGFHPELLPEFTSIPSQTQPFVTSITKLLGSLITCSTCISACADGALWQMAIDLLQEVEVCTPGGGWTSWCFFRVGLFNLKKTGCFEVFLRGYLDMWPKHLIFERAKRESSKRNHEMMIAWNYMIALTTSSCQSWYLPAFEAVWIKIPKSWVWASYGLKMVTHGSQKKRAGR